MHLSHAKCEADTLVNNIDLISWVILKINMYRLFFIKNCLPFFVIKVFRSPPSSCHRSYLPFYVPLAHLLQLWLQRFIDANFSCNEKNFMVAYASINVFVCRAFFELLIAPTKLIRSCDMGSWRYLWSCHIFFWCYLGWCSLYLCNFVTYLGFHFYLAGYVPKYTSVCVRSFLN